MPAKVTCLTCGAEGVWFKTMQGQWQHSEAVKVNVADSTGAGDAFWAGFLTSWMQKQPLEICVQQAITTAARRLESKI
jgi:fructokinase